MSTDTPSSGKTPFSTFDESILAEKDPQETIVYPSAIAEEGHGHDMTSHEQLTLALEQ